jgi:hypothetical protein
LGDADDFSDRFFGNVKGVDENLVVGVQLGGMRAQQLSELCDPWI